MVDLYPEPQDDIAALIAILEEAFPGMAVSTRRPMKWSESFIRVTRIGGYMSNIVTDTGRQLIECWALDGPTARGMTRTARAALRNAQGKIFDGAFIRSWDDEQGPVDFPDPDVPSWYRWQFHGDLSVSTTPGS